METQDNEFTSLVKNALDFLTKSIKELEAGETKYSVINFYSGVELLLKARLLREHWCLCASDVNKMAQKQFTSGDFESIGLKEAKSRLANILGCKLSVQEENTYEKLRERRNRAVHFYHPDDLRSEKKVAIEQLVGWHFLYRRLTESWKDCFEPFLPELEKLHGAISPREEYYPSIYAEMKDEIQKKAKNRLIANCELCGQKSALTKGEVVKGVHRLDCTVCSGETFVLFLPCRKCGKLAPRTFEPANTCQWCGGVNAANLEESFKWAETTYPAAFPNAWCGDCGYTVRESVIAIDTASLCLACHAFYEHSDVGCCGYCGSRVTGLVGDRFSPGCVRCEHSFSYEESNEKAPDYMYDLAERRKYRANRRWRG